LSSVGYGQPIYYLVRSLYLNRLSVMLSLGLGLGFKTEFCGLGLVTFGLGLGLAMFGLGLGLEVLGVV